MTSSVKRGFINVNIVTGAALFALMLLLNFMCPYLSDDWHFMFVWEDFLPTDDPKRVDSFGDIITSMRNYYAMSGGRVVPHFITYCLLLFPKWVFNILNSAMFVVLTVLLYRISLCYLKSSPKWLYPMVCLMVLHLLPGFGDNVLWISGAVNYLWMAVLMLCCIYWLIARAENALFRECLLMLPVFMLSAATNEVTGGMLMIAVAIRFICLKKRSVIRLVMFLAAEIPGMLLVILAPGNEMRIRHAEEQGIDMDTPLLVNLSDYIWFLIDNYLLFMVLILLAAVICVFSQNSLSEFLHEHLCFIVGMCGIAALSVAGYFTERPTFFGCCLFVPAIIIAFDVLFDFFIDLQKEKPKRLISGVKVCLDLMAVLLIVLAVIKWYYVLLFVSVVAVILVMRVLVTLSQGSNGKKIIGGAAKHVKKFLVVIIIVIGANALLNTVNYIRGVNAYIDFQNKAMALINDNKNEMVSEMAFYNYNYGAFFPDESTSSIEYLVLWFDAYIKSAG